MTRLLFLFLIATMSATGQDYYLYTIDVESGRVDSMRVEAANTTARVATDWFEGGLPGRTELPDTMPPQDLSWGTVSKLAPAHSVTNVSHFPARTACAIRIDADTATFPSCSAVLVGDRWAVTSAHCVVESRPIGPKKDVYRLYPAWDDSSSQTPVRFAEVRKIYVVKHKENTLVHPDLALLELDAPIGNEVGWVGMMSLPEVDGELPDVINWLSYPASEAIYPPNHRFDGDTLWHRYGKGWYSVFHSAVTTDSSIAVGGESGAPLLIRHNNGYVTIAAIKSAYGIGSHAFTGTVYNAFKDVIERPVSVQAHAEEPLTVIDEYLVDLQGRRYTMNSPRAQGIYLHVRVTNRGIKAEASLDVR